MELGSKIAKLELMNEEELRNDLLAPLLSRMGFKAVTIYHGAQERGKDIVCFDHDRLNRRVYLGVVAKTTQLDGSVSSNHSLREIVHQVRECFSVPYEDLFGMTQVTMDQVWVVTTGRIVPGAANSVFAELQGSNLSKLVRIVPRDNLIELVDSHFGEFWDDSLESIETVRQQRLRLRTFCSKLLQAVGGSSASADSVLNQVVNSPFSPTLSGFHDYTAQHMGAYRVEIDSIDKEYANRFDAAEGFVSDLYFKVRKELYYAMFEVEEIIDAYEKVMGKTNPREFVDTFEDELSDKYPFWKADFGRASDVLRIMDNLRSSVNDVQELMAGLQQLGKLEWSIGLVNSVDALREAVQSYLTHVDQASFELKWQIETIDGVGQLRFLGAGGGDSGTDAIFTSHKRERETYSRSGPQSRATNASDIVSEVQLKLRKYLDSLLRQAGLPGPDL